MADELITNIAKEIAKDVYADGGKPVVKPVGELAALVPRAIKAALAPVEKWVLQREYSVAETKKLLEEKLQNIPAEQIVPPEPYIAVPALQYISYCMDNDELRDMYANLLASSMNEVVKDGVHPGYVEIIKQLSPDEAKILKYIKAHTPVPIITLRYENEQGHGIDIVKNFSNIGEHSKCEKPQDIAKYFDNLVRLGILTYAPYSSSLTNTALYEPLKNHRWIIPHANDKRAKQYGFEKYRYEESYISLTNYGKEFCDLCLTAKNNVSVKIVKKD